jgi:NADH-quinone oxidoreductase subunit C
MNTLLNKLASKFNFTLLEEFPASATILLENITDIIKLTQEIKHSKKFRMLIDICGVDYPSKAKRFEVVYQFLNMEENLRLTVKLSLAENEKVPSITKIHSGACWFERETFDMYGIEFSDTHDGRRILTDYNFEGFPLRKDFPLTGFTELQFDPTENKIVQKPVNLSQEYREFDFESPWENVQYNIKKA